MLTRDLHSDGTRPAPDRFLARANGQDTGAGGIRVQQWLEGRSCNMRTPVCTMVPVSEVLTSTAGREADIIVYRCNVMKAC